MNASEFEALADECQIVEELSVRQVVSIVTDVQVESDDVQNAEEPFVAPTITALEIKSTRRGLYATAQELSDSACM